MSAARQQLYSGYKQMAEQSEHDPIDRQLPGEERFPLMGRDILSPAMIRLYACLLEGNLERADGVYQALRRTALTRNPRPHKDNQHAWSARAIADRMENWFRDNMTGQKPNHRINDAPDRDEGFQSMPTQAEIRAARPPHEPDEAS